MSRIANFDDLDPLKLEPALSLTMVRAGQVVPVTLHPKVTEVGTLELWLQHTQSAHRWKLDFNLRHDA